MWSNAGARKHTVWVALVVSTPIHHFISCVQQEIDRCTSTQHIETGAARTCSMVLLLGSYAPNIITSASGRDDDAFGRLQSFTVRWYGQEGGVVGSRVTDRVQNDVTQVTCANLQSHEWRQQ